MTCSVGLHRAALLKINDRERCTVDAPLDCRSPTGAGTQCCYDAAGHLMYAGDSIYGSTVDKSHHTGSPDNYMKPQL